MSTENPTTLKVIYDMCRDNRRLIIVNLLLTAAIIGEKAVDILSKLLA